MAEEEEGLEVWWWVQEGTVCWVEEGSSRKDLENRVEVGVAMDSRSHWVMGEECSSFGSTRS